MSFDLLSFKKEKIEKWEEKYTQHLVVGNDVYALATYRALVSKYGEDQVLLFMSEKITTEDLMFLGPTSLRGEENKKMFSQKFPDMETIESRDSIFFKELKWREFGGRSKSEQLLHDEVFFTQPGESINEDKLTSFFFPDSTLEIEEINSNAHIAHILELRKEHPEDMIDPIHWSIKTSDGALIKTRKIYWAGSPNSFMHFLKNKEELSDHYIQFCESTHAPALLRIRLVFEEKITDKKETLFIPLSYTHEWGHFIGEFHASSNEQTADFFAFIDTDHSNEERISKIIRILKRNLEKIFPQIKKISYREFISLEEEGPCHKIDDVLYGEISKEAPGLVFLGVNAPLTTLTKKNESCEDSNFSPSYIMRGILSFSELQNSIHS